MRYIRKFFITLLFFWFCLALLLFFFGTDLFFPFGLEMGESEELYRYETVRFGVGCLLAFSVFRYLFSFKAMPSLGIVFYYGVFYIIGGCVIGFRDNIGLEPMYHIAVVAILTILIFFEIRQKKK
ncbi:MAG: hypothetical protein CL573_09680, partial [Alphaproteobacteria bacterium]|nr:hypothetical protein [Alphaproteobacteria bacterium]